MSENELKQFDQLKADVTIFVSPTKDIRVTDFKTSQQAIEAVKQVKMYLAHVEKKRVELVKPLNDQVKLVNAYAKDIEAPLKDAETFIKSQLVKFEMEQEQIRRELMRKAEEERREAERQAQAERARIAREVEEKKQAELAEVAEKLATSETGSFFGTEVDPYLHVDADRVRIEEEAHRTRLEEEARLSREAIARQSAHEQRTWDIERQGIKNAKKNWKCEAVDLALVPREFLIISLNTQAILAAARAGVTTIPGVKVWQETSISIGQNTYVPREALEE